MGVVRVIIGSFLLLRYKADTDTVRHNRRRDIMWNNIRGWSSNDKKGFVCFVK